MKRTKEVVKGDKDKPQTPTNQNKLNIDQSSTRKDKIQQSQQTNREHPQTKSKHYFKQYSHQQPHTNKQQSRHQTTSNQLNPTHFGHRPTHSPDPYPFTKSRTKGPPRTNANKCLSQPQSSDSEQRSFRLKLSCCQLFCIWVRSLCPQQSSPSKRKHKQEIHQSYSSSKVFNNGPSTDRKQQSNYESHSYRYQNSRGQKNSSLQFSDSLTEESDNLQQPNLPWTDTKKIYVRPYQVQTISEQSKSKHQSSNSNINSESGQQIVQCVQNPQIKTKRTSKEQQQTERIYQQQPAQTYRQQLQRSTHHENTHNQIHSPYSQIHTSHFRIPTSHSQKIANNFSQMSQKYLPKLTLSQEKLLLKIRLHQIYDEEKKSQKFSQKSHSTQSIHPGQLQQLKMMMSQMLTQHLNKYFSSNNSTMPNISNSPGYAPPSHLFHPYLPQYSNEYPSHQKNWETNSSLGRFNQKKKRSSSSQSHYNLSQYNNYEDRRGRNDENYSSRGDQVRHSDKRKKHNLSKKQLRAEYWNQKEIERNSLQSYHGGWGRNQREKGREREREDSNSRRNSASKKSQENKEIERTLQVSRRQENLPGNDVNQKDQKFPFNPNMTRKFKPHQFQQQNQYHKLMFRFQPNYIKYGQNQYDDINDYSFPEEFQDGEIKKMGKFQSYNMGPNQANITFGQGKNLSAVVSGYRTNLTESTYIQIPASKQLKEANKCPSCTSSNESQCLVKVEQNKFDLLQTRNPVVSNQNSNQSMDQKKLGTAITALMGTQPQTEASGEVSRTFLGESGIKMERSVNVFGMIGRVVNLGRDGLEMNQLSGVIGQGNEVLNGESSMEVLSHLCSEMGSMKDKNRE